MKNNTDIRNTKEYTTWMILNRARNSIYRVRELELARFGLTVEQSGILSILTNRGGSATSKTIEDLTLRQHNSIFTLVNRMIKMDLIEKRINQGNNKFEFLITKHGESLHIKVPVHSMESIFSSLKGKDRELFVYHLNLLLKRARDLLGLSFIPPFLLKTVDASANPDNNIQIQSGNKDLTDFEMWMLLHRTSNSLYRLRELELAQFSLTVEQAAILSLLLSHGGLTSAKTIENITSRQHHSISTLINRMIKIDLVTRRRNPVTRKSEILITPHGEDLYRTIPDHSLKMLFSTLKVQQLDHLLNTLNVLLEKARGMLGLS